ncbi:hypothetical protein DENSPDRAFT_596019 [Dentipellis sp. KUC8613]|nr:hypothetical protein DENSPDRAFT_596019 [Dentipellis sp. KUC8613]
MFSQKFLTRPLRYLAHSSRVQFAEHRYTPNAALWFSSSRCRGNTTQTAPEGSPALVKPIRKPWTHRPWFTTLDPTRLSPSDFCDISGVQLARPLPTMPSGKEMAFEYTSFGGPRTSFPPHTHGFFYYIPAPTDDIGELRFRITPDNNPEGFARGHDLLLPSGIPWVVRSIFFSTQHAEGLCEVLLRDGLVTPAAVAAARARNIRTARRAISALNQPFPINLINHSWVVTVVSGPKVSKAIVMCIRGQRTGPFFSGSALCCFERSTLPIHAGRRVLVVRLLELVTPLVQVAPLPADCAMDTPRVGELLTTRGRPVAVDVDRGSRCSQTLRLLWKDP